MRKQLDPRIPSLLSQSIAQNHRSFLILLGDPQQQQSQIVNLHFLLSQSRVGSRPSVLWCYKKDLGFTTHRKKREARIKRDIKSGRRELDEQSPFELFLTVTNISYTYYKDSHKILGQTYGMLVLQDFEAITPNLLARTVETVEGGGIVVLMVSGKDGLRGLYDLQMDVHSRYRTESHVDIQPRFNERFILSLCQSPACLVLDDELNVLPISAGSKLEIGTSTNSASGNLTKLKSDQSKRELDSLKQDLVETPIIGPLAKLCATTDQLRSLLTFLSSGISPKSLSSTISLTSPRGRGKSSSLGLSIAAAIASGYSNIFVTSPAPENLGTLFEFLGKGLRGLGYEEGGEFEIVRRRVDGEQGEGRGGGSGKGVVVRVNVFRGHRQTVQYIQPQDSHVLGQAELLIIDEAAAIPLPLVRKLLGPYLVFMASTINGYEGTGRSLSLKLIQQLRDQTRPIIALNSEAAPTGGSSSAAKTASSVGHAGKAGSGLARTLTEIKLDQPIRYGSGDPIEKWLNGLLCLDASTISKSISGCPHPSTCELFYVNRDTLFSFHPASEVFLQRMMSLYVASHYKNSPNDLQLMSDAPAHHLFVLLPPLKDDESTLPDPLVVIQVALEGNISRQNIMSQLAKGVRSGGDLIPWLVSQQYQDDHFAMLSGARVVRIATHPDYARMGYGARALEALGQFYSGDLLNLDEAMEEATTDAFADSKKADKATNEIHVRDPAKMPPLLQRLSERKPEQLDYLGVSYGLTKDLLRFWKRAGYVPLYIRQTSNDLTGEHTCVMLKTLDSTVAGSQQWLSAFAQDFRRRFLSLLSYKFREFDASLALSVIEAANAGENVGSSKILTGNELNTLLTPFDLKRIESYSNNLLDYHVVLDLLPTISSLFFTRRFGPEVSLAAVQQAILLALGLQRKSIEDVEGELKIPVNQGLALFVKIMRKVSKYLRDLQKEAAGVDIPVQEPEVRRKIGEAMEGEQVGTSDWRPMPTTVEEDLEEAVDEESKKARALQRELIDSIDLAKYAIDDGADFSEAHARVKAIANAEPEHRQRLSTVVTVKGAAPAAIVEKPVTKRKSDKDHGGRDHKKSKGSKVKVKA